MAIPRLQVTAPTLRPTRFGLFSAADVKMQNDGHWQAGTSWESDACIADLNYTDAVCAPIPDEVQTLAITGVPTGGTYTLTFDGQTTAAITYNANAAAVTSALVALSNVASGDITVTGTYPNFTVTYGGAYADTNVGPLTKTSSLTGGTAPNVAIATTTDGYYAPKVVAESGGTYEAAPFVVYAMRECRAVGDYAQASTRATDILVNSEERAVEAEVWARFTTDADAVNITPATAPSPEVGLAMLEAWMGDTYAGAPTIHVQRDIGSYLGTKGAVERHGTHLESTLGSYVSAGNGYGTAGVAAAAPAAGTRWMWASSTVNIGKGTAFVKGPLFVQSPLDNTQVVLAERVYTSGYECVPVGIRVTFP